MALNVGSSYLCVFNPRRREILRVRAVASEDIAPSITKEEKVKLGGSELKVTRLGIGAWSWGDTSYWNNFEWDGNNYPSLNLMLKTWL
uniref:Aldo/keto reductase family protein n=1 Tax=Rhizophora mucronata TaxID=61149 RepID=A0A2P2L821_RHIMU